MSTERDELAEVVGEALEKGPGIYDTSWDQDCAMADTILKAGYRKPRTVTTVEELDTLHMVVVRTEAGTIANIVDGRAYCFGYEQSAPVGALALPVAILWEAPNA